MNGTISYDEYRRIKNQILLKILEVSVELFDDSKTKDQNIAIVKGNNNFISQGIQNSSYSTNRNNISGNELTYNEDKMKNPIKILFISANPQELDILDSEFDEIVVKLQREIDNNEINFLSPIWDADYEKLLLRLKKDHPNVLHYSGHGTENGLCLKNMKTGITQLLENEYLKEVFENRSEYLKLVLLNSCYSGFQAKLISETGIFVLGVKDEIEYHLAKELAERFYLGFTVQECPIKIEKAIKIGCKNFVLTFPEYGDLITLWKDGKEISYTVL